MSRVKIPLIALIENLLSRLNQEALQRVLCSVRQKHDVYTQYTPYFKYTPFKDVSKNISSFIPSWRRNKSANKKIWEEIGTHLVDGVYTPYLTYPSYLWYVFSV